MKTKSAGLKLGLFLLVASSVLTLFLIRETVEHNKQTKEEGNQVSAKHRQLLYTAAAWPLVFSSALFLTLIVKTARVKCAGCSLMMLLFFVMNTITTVPYIESKDELEQPLKTLVLLSILLGSLYGVSSFVGVVALLCKTKLCALESGAVDQWKAEQVQQVLESSRKTKCGSARGKGAYEESGREFMEKNCAICLDSYED